MSAPARARATDPDTSHDAAASIDTGKQNARVLAIIEARGAEGTTLDDLEDAMPEARMVSFSSVPARLEAESKIHDSGRVRPGRTGRNQKVWLPGFGLTSPPRVTVKQRALDAIESMRRSQWAKDNPQLVKDIVRGVRGGSK